MDSAIVIPNIEILRQTFDSVSGALFLADKEGKVVYANKALEQRTGFSVPETVGKKPKDLWGGNMESFFYNDLWKRIRNDRLPFVGSVVNRRKSGEAYDDPMHVAPIFDDTGAISYYIEVQPKLEKVEKLMKFQNEFQSVLSQQLVFGSNIIEWVLPWLDPGQSPVQRVFEAIKDVGRVTKHLGNFLSDVFVQPTQRFFYSREEDKELILAAQQDSQAFKKLYIKYKKDIYQYFLYHNRQEPHIAEDLAQETFYRALRYLPAFQVSNASYRTYLQRVAHSILINHYRQIQPVLIEEEDFLRPDIKKEYKDIIEKEIIWDKVSSLPGQEQQVIRMYYQEELSIHEIAALLNKSDNAVKLSLSRARKKLKEGLNVLK